MPNCESHVERRISRIGLGLAIYGGLNVFVGIGSILFFLDASFVDSFGRGLLLASMALFLAFGAFLLAVGLRLRRHRDSARKGAAALCYTLSAVCLLFAINAVYLWLPVHAANLTMGLFSLAYTGALAYGFFRAGRYFASSSVRALFPTS